MIDKKQGRIRRSKQVRRKIAQLRAVRLLVHRSNTHIYAQVIDADAKRLHVHSLILNEDTGAVLAVNEEVLMHVDQAGGPRSAPFPPEVAALVAARRARDGDAHGPRTGGVGLAR